MADKSFRSVLEKEALAMKNLMLDLECGIVAPESLPLPPQFYAQKRQRIEDVLWALDVEERALSKPKPASTQEPKEDAKA